MNAESASPSWYYARQGAPAGAAATGAPQPVGPFTWAQLLSLAQSGQLSPADLIWNPQLPEWTPASQMPGLFARPGTAPAQPGAAQPFDTAARITAVRPAPRPAARRAPWFYPVVVTVVIVIVAAAAIGAYFGLTRGSDDTAGRTTSSTTISDSTTTAAGETTTTAGPGTGGTGLGAAEVKQPDDAKMIRTKTWGAVPANQIDVMMADGTTRADAESLATTLGGTIVGEVECIRTYQIEVASASTEADLVALLDKAAAMPGVEVAFPNTEAVLYTEIWGDRQDALSDPAYGEGRDKGYKLIGADRAWQYIKGSGLELSEVQIGIIDSGLFQGSSEFNGSTKFTFPEGGGKLNLAVQLTNPATKEKFPDPAGSHGTGVAGLIGADPKNGGMTGIASTALGDKLTVSLIDNTSGRYGSNWAVRNPDPDDPTLKQKPDGSSQAMASLVAIVKQIEAEARVINCSWGSGQDATAQTASVHKKFFTQMAQDYPDVLFVCAAGNDGGKVDGTTHWPGGLKLPNMITIGNVMNDGTKAASSTTANTTPGQEYEVTLAAPGEQAVIGVGPDGQAVTDATAVVGPNSSRGGGTSMAAPQVTAAAALLLALDATLSAGQIKDILTRTARSGPAELGGKTLAIDAAVLEVINKLREEEGSKPLTADVLANAGAIDAVATGDPVANLWTVKATLGGPPMGDGAAVTITYTQGVSVPGYTSTLTLDTGPVLFENITLPKDQTAEITVTREDTGASSVITLPPDLSGEWVGTMTITKIELQTMEAEMQAEFLGCDPNSIDWQQFVDWMAGTPLPATMEIVLDASGLGIATILVDASPLKAKAEAMGDEVEQISSTPIKFKLTYKDYKAVFEVAPGQDLGTGGMTIPINRPKTGLVLEGVMISDNQGVHLEASCKFMRK